MTRWFWVVPLLLAVVACSSPVPGSALPDPRVAPAPRAAAGQSVELLGDPSTLDACSLVDPAELSQFGAAELPAQESYDYCWLRLPVAGASVAVRFGLLERIRAVEELPAKEIESVGTLRVFEETPVPDRCVRYVVFNDNITLAVSADTVDSPDAKVSELCSVTEKTTSVVASNINARKVAHRAYEQASLGKLDACNAAVTSLAQVPGLAAAEINRYPAHHQCQWGNAIVPSLTLRYVLDEPSTAANVAHETIAGKASGVYSVDVSGRSLCVAEVKGIGRELAQVAVRLAPNNADAACAAARGVANEVWSKLPATS
jgi:hypothetical protein